jgi:hypothetical protein
MDDSSRFSGARFVTDASGARLDDLRTRFYGFICFQPSRWLLLKT